MAQVNMPKSSIGQQPAAEPQKKFQKVVKGKVTLKEQNDIQKIANEFLAEEGVISPNDVKLIEYVDAPQDAWDYIKTFYKL